MSEEKKNKQEPEYFNLDITIKNIRGKEMYEYNKIETAESEYGYEVLEEADAQGNVVYIEKIPKKVGDVIGAALIRSSNDDKVDYKKRINRGILAESIVKNPKKIQLTIPQITVILQLVEELKDTTSLMRVAEVIDPDHKIKPLGSDDEI